MSCVGVPESYQYELSRGERWDVAVNSSAMQSLELLSYVFKDLS